jgi:hypothetical protein
MNRAKMDAARTAAGDYLSKINELVELQKQFDQAVAAGYDDEYEVPYGFLRDATQLEGNGVYLAVGLMMTASLAVIYHRDTSLSSDVYDDVLDQMNTLALQLSEMKRQEHAEERRSA